MGGRRTIAVAIGLLLLLAAAGCGGGEPKERCTANRALQICATSPQKVERVVFIQDGEQRVIEPSGLNRALAVVRVRLINNESAFVPLFISDKSAELGDPLGERISAMDPIQASQVAEPPDDKTDRYSPFLWGNVNLTQGYQVAGWMVFDVPENLPLDVLWWNDPELTSLDYTR